MTLVQRHSVGPLLALVYIFMILEIKKKKSYNLLDSSFALVCFRYYDPHLSKLKSPFGKSSANSMAWARSLLGKEGSWFIDSARIQE